MVKTALRGKGTRGGGSASGGNGRGGGAGRGKEPAGEREASGGGGSGGGGFGRGGAGGKGPAPEYIPLGELAAIAAARTSKSRGKRHTGTSDAGGSPVARPGSNGGSCNSSNPSPPSLGTRVSHSNLSAGRTIPLQYPSSTNPQVSSRNVEANLNLNMRPVGGEVRRDAEAGDEEDEEDRDAEAGDEEDEEDRDDEEELQDDAVENYELGADFEAVAAQQPQGLDDEQLLANLLALPGRQRLPLLSEVPVPDSLW